MNEMRRVGVLMRKTRFRALESDGLFSSPTEDQSFCFSHVDPAAPLKAGESYDVLLHKVDLRAIFGESNRGYVLESYKVAKVSDFLGNEGGIARIQTFLAEFIAACPKVVVMDELEYICQIFDRVKMAEGAARIQCTTSGGHKICAPAFVEVLPGEDAAKVEAKALAAGLQLPCIVKDRSACGGEASHRMALLLSWAGLQQIPDHRPRILQSFVNHGGIIHKVYVIGDQVQIVHKDSVPDLPELHLGALPPVLEFDSLLMGETLAGLGKLEGMNHSNSEGTHSLPLRSEVVHAAVAALREQWHFTLFGFDMVVSHSGEAYIIDVNYFPSFKGFPCAAQHLQTALRGKCKILNQRELDLAGQTGHHL